MKEFITKDPESFNLVKNIENYNGKIKLKKFLKEYWYIDIMYVSAIFSTIVYKKTLNLFNLITSHLILVLYTVYAVICEKIKLRKYAIEDMKHSMFIDDNSIILDIKDIKNAIIENEVEYENYVICDGLGTKVNSKKVISYIALPKKEKLTIYKQIASHFKYDNKDMEDKDFIQIFLLEEKDLKDENFINNDNSLNLNNSLVKKLVKKHDNIKKII